MSVIIDTTTKGYNAAAPVGKDAALRGDATHTLTLRILKPAQPTPAPSKTSPLTPQNNEGKQAANFSIRIVHNIKLCKEGVARIGKNQPASKLTQLTKNDVIHVDDMLGRQRNCPAVLLFYTEWCSACEQACQVCAR